MNKLLSIHEDSQSDEQVGGGRGGQAAQVGRDEEGGRDRHQAGGHQLNGRVFFSWAGKMLIEQISNLNSATNSCTKKREKVWYINQLFFLSPAALKASLAKAIEATQSKTGSKKPGIWFHDFNHLILWYLKQIALWSFVACFSKWIPPRIHW